MAQPLSRAATLPGVESTGQNALANSLRDGGAAGLDAGRARARRVPPAESAGTGADLAHARDEGDGGGAERARGAAPEAAS